MEATPYTDLYVMKGWEYLLVIVFLVALAVFWRYLMAPKPGTAAARAKSASRTLLGSWFRLPAELFYHRGHTWAEPERLGLVRVGIDDFAQKLLGRPSGVDLPRVGSMMAQGSTGWRLLFGGRSIELLSPVDGEVVEVNGAVLDSPDLVNADPYGDGWLLRVRVPELRSNLKNLLTGRLARSWLEDTVRALRLRMGGQLGMVMQDGGLPVSGFVRALSDDHWETVAAEFLLTGDSDEGPSQDA
jgi:glycine cleavage system H lipoate-binding protein